MSEQVVIVNAENQILGRMATYIVKLLKQGKKVIVVNADRAIISGPRSRVVKSYQILFKVRKFQNPERNTIKRPRNPINILKRTVRGMLPKNESGRMMLKNLKVYVGIPEEYKDKQMIRFEDADVKRLKGKYITIGELSKLLGGMS